MDEIYLYVPLVPERYVGWVRVKAAQGHTWLTPEEAEELADNLREAALAARRGI